MAISSKPRTTAPKTANKTNLGAPVTAPVVAGDSSKTPNSATIAPTVVETLTPVVVSNELRKKELFELVVERSGMKKRDVKPVVEAMLAVLGDALAEQREMDLQPLGKLKVQRGKELSDGHALVLKLRQKTARLNAVPGTDLNTDAQ